MTSKATTSSKISESLVTTLKQLPDDGATTVIVIFDEQLTPDQNAALTEPGIDRQKKLEILRASSIKAQEASLDFLNKKGKDYLTKVKNVEFDESKVKRLEYLNAMVLPANAKLVEDLASQPNILTIIPNQKYELIAPTRTSPSEVEVQEKAEGITWGLKELKIDQIWKEYGLKGKGILVGHLDSGVYDEHPDLKGKIEKWTFIDPLGRELSGSPPFDTGFHGTHTAGIIVGGNESGIHIGVAPEAKLASAGMLVEKAELPHILPAMDWAVKNQVSVLSISLGGRYEPDVDRFLERLIQQDIFPVCAIGNGGFGSTRSPGNFIDAVGVGAIDSNGNVTDFSGGATLSWYNRITGNFDNDIKPDICAPGKAIFSSIPPLGEGIYAHYDGTSMAAPHVAGVAALLLEAIEKSGKEISVRSLIDLIYKHTSQRDKIGHNNRYGRGIIDPLKTLREILEA